MTEDEFYEPFHHMERSGISKVSLRFAAKKCREQGISNPNTCRDLATYLDEYWQYRKHEERMKDEMVARSKGPSTYAHSLRGHEMMWKLDIWAEAIREELAPWVQLPLQSKEQMTNWIEQVEKAPSGLAPEEQRSLFQLKSEIQQKKTEWFARTGLDWRSDGRPRWLTYEKPETGGIGFISLPDPDPWEEHPAVWSPLARLQRASLEGAEITGLLPAQVVTYILTGIEPPLPRWSITWNTLIHESTEIVRKQVTIDVFAGDISDKEERAIHRELRTHFKRAQKKQITTQDEAYYTLVKEMGGPPRGQGAMVVWENIRQAWLRMYPDENLGTPNAARTKFMRLTERLPRIGSDEKLRKDLGKKINKHWKQNGQALQDPNHTQHRRVAKRLEKLYRARYGGSDESSS